MKVKKQKATNLVVSPNVLNPYDPPKPLGFNLRKAVAYAKEHNIQVRDIPEEILKEL